MSDPGISEILNASLKTKLLVLTIRFSHKGHENPSSFNHAGMWTARFVASGIYVADVLVRSPQKVFIDVVLIIIDIVISVLLFSKLNKMFFGYFIHKTIFR